MITLPAEGESGLGIRDAFLVERVPISRLSTGKTQHSSLQIHWQSLAFKDDLGKTLVGKYTFKRYGLGRTLASIDNLLPAHRRSKLLDVHENMLRQKREAAENTKERACNLGDEAWQQLKVGFCLVCGIIECSLIDHIGSVAVEGTVSAGFSAQVTTDGESGMSQHVTVSPWREKKVDPFCLVLFDASRVQITKNAGRHC